MIELSSEKQKALSGILLDFANNDSTTTWETMSAILGVLGQDTGLTLRDQFAMAAHESSIDKRHNELVIKAYHHGKADAHGGEK
jgi:hypothetical protein